MSKKVKITLTLSEEDASILRQLAANDIRTLPKYCEAVLIRTARANRPPVLIPQHIPQPLKPIENLNAPAQQQAGNPHDELL